jgi:hypothetical protein
LTHSGGGIKNSQRFTCSGITPLAVDEKLSIGVGHDCSFKSNVFSIKNKSQIKSL